MLVRLNQFIIRLSYLFIIQIVHGSQFLINMNLVDFGCARKREGGEDYRVPNSTPFVFLTDQLTNCFVYVKL